MGGWSFFKYEHDSQILRCLLSVGLLVGEAAAWLSLLGQLGGEVLTMTITIRSRPYFT